MGQHNFEKPLEFHNFSEIFYCDMTRLRNTKLSVLIRCQYTRTIICLFKKHSKFQNFDEIFYFDMTRLRKTYLDVFMQC